VQSRIKCREVLAEPVTQTLLEQLREIQEIQGNSWEIQDTHQFQK
jgi:hypothetical protein